MNCPKCYNSNTSDSFYCHNCGHKLKNNPNNWARFFAVLFFAAGILAIYFYSEFQSQGYRISRLEYANRDIRNESDRKANESQTTINNLEGEVRRQKNEITNKDNEIYSLRIQLPKTYTTMYSNQYLYNKCGGKYEQANCYFPSSGTTVYIYTQEDDYGLTSIGGWIPMNCLTQY